MISGKEPQMIERKCPLCSGSVKTHSTHIRPLADYTCPQCGAKLWLTTCSLGYRLTVAQSGVRT
ncbi:MAG: hypothetical protein A4E23_01250 [Methanomethylovorans sp. PtaU1.Bin073]|nr:MAG: hypothetical protein A4E23_01250 [Methanomethylovorans sp. PtaU1.Bin073]